MNLNHNRSSLFLVLGYVTTLCGAGYAAYAFHEEVNLKREEEQGLKEQIRLADTKIARIPSLETDVICLRENVDHLVKILPSEKEVNEFVNKINDFSMASGIQISELKPEKDRDRKKKNVFDKVIYKLSMTSNLDQFLRFLSLCEGWDRFVRVTKVQVDAGDWSEDMHRDDVVHDISVDLETYAYQGHDDPSKLSTNIQNYDRRKSALSGEILSRRSEIRTERFSYVPDPLRRDPFVDPRYRLGDSREGGLPYDEQVALTDRLSGVAAELALLLEDVIADDVDFLDRMEIESRINLLGSELNAEVELATSDGAVTDPVVRRRFEREVMSVLRTLGRRDSVEVIAATLDDLTHLRDELSRLLAEGEYESIIHRSEVVSERLDASSLGAAGKDLIQSIAEIAHSAEVAHEIASRDFDIGGTIVSDTRSVVVLNGRVFQEGDAVEEGLLIHRIARDRIEFEYEGVVVTWAW